MLRPFLFSLTTAMIALTGACTTVSEPTEAAAPTVIAEPELIVEPVAPIEIAAPEPVQEPQEPSFMDLAASDWTVQIAALKDLEKITWIEIDHLAGEDILHIPTRDAEHGDLHAVLVGTYNTYEEATAAAHRLPHVIAGDDPWVRTVASVQAVMR